MRKSDARTLVTAELIAKTNEMADAGQTLIHPKQKEIALNIVSSFLMGTTLVSLMTPPQFGKTSVCMFAMYLMATHIEDALSIHPGDIYYLTGMSDVEWVKQTRGRMIRSFMDRVIHRPKLHTIIDKIKAKSGDALATGKTPEGVLLVVDECHFGNGADQTIHKCLKDAGLLDLDVLKANNIKILNVSATPMHVLIDSEKWGPDAHHKVVVNGRDDPAYVGFHTLLEEGRVRKINLKKPSDIAKLVQTIETRWPPAPSGEPGASRYHIVRMSEALRQQSGILEVIGDHGYTYSFHDSTNRIKDIDRMLDTAPIRHHFIFIKAFWKASKTLNDTNIGVCYDMSTDDIATAQGLAGRLLGYGKQRGEAAPIVYCNLAQIKEYIAWLDNGCDYRKCRRVNCGPLKMSRGIVRKIKASSVHPAGIDNLVPYEVPAGSGADDADDPKSKLVPKPLGTVKETAIPKDALRATTIEVLSRDEFIAKYKLTKLTNLTTMPKKAEDLSKMLKANGFPTRTSYANNSAATVSNLVNYYTKPSWAADAYHVICVEDSVNVTVIKRNTEMLANVKKGDRVIAHYHTGDLKQYVF